eukprot:2882633-Amphidinium_carterae.1
MKALCLDCNSRFENVFPIWSRWVSADSSLAPEKPRTNGCPAIVKSPDKVMPNWDQGKAATTSSGCSSQTVTE